MPSAYAIPDRIEPDALVRADRRVMVRRYVGALSRDPAEVDDLTQEVFVRAIERIDRIADAQRIDPFLRGIARRVVQEHFRARRRSCGYVELIADAMIAAVSTGSPHQIAHERLMQRMLAVEIERLPVVSRRMIEMRYHAGLNASQIGVAMGIEHSAVRVTLLRVRRRLKNRIAARAAAARVF